MTSAGIHRASVSTTTTAIPTCIARSPNTVMHHFKAMAPTSPIPSPPNFFSSFQWFCLLSRVHPPSPPPPPSLQFHSCLHSSFICRSFPFPKPAAPLPMAPHSPAASRLTTDRARCL